MRYSPFLSCRQAARLITAELDRELNPLERIGLRMHLSICDACPIVVRQLAQVREAMHALRDTAEQ